MDLFRIRTDAFEGPLDLMLFLIQKNELDISKISIHKITDQYVRYVTLMKSLDFNLAAEFLLMAAILIFLKSKRILPSLDDQVVAPEETILAQTEEQIVERLKKRKLYQEAAKALAERPRRDRDFWTREQHQPLEKRWMWQEVDHKELSVAMLSLLTRSKRRNRVIIRESLSLPEWILKIAKILPLDEITEFSSLLTADPSRDEIVGSFVALLEMARLKKVRVYQQELFGSIYVKLIEAFTDLDPKLITGFQYKAQAQIQELSITSDQGAS